MKPSERRKQHSHGAVEFTTLWHEDRQRWQIIQASITDWVGPLDLRFRYLTELYTDNFFGTDQDAVRFVESVMRISLAEGSVYRLRKTPVEGRFALVLVS